MAKAPKNNEKKKKTGNESYTDLPDMKTTSQTTTMGSSMKEKLH